MQHHYEMWYKNVLMGLGSPRHIICRTENICGEGNTGLEGALLPWRIWETESMEQWEKFLSIRDVYAAPFAAAASVNQVLPWFCFCLLSFTAPVMQTCSINERNERSNHQELRAKCLSQGLLGGKKFTCISVMWETQYQKVMLIKMRIFYLQVSKSILMSFLTEWTYII